MHHNYLNEGKIVPNWKWFLSFGLVRNLSVENKNLAPIEWPIA